MRRGWLLGSSLVLALTAGSSGWATEAPVAGFEPDPEILRALDVIRSEPVRHGFLARVRAAKVAREAVERGDKAFGGTVVQGTVAAPVVTTTFSNVGAPYAAANLQQMLFNGPWPTGTMTEYYDEISYGNLNVPGTVYNWVPLPQADTYYAGTGNGLTCNGRVWELIQQSLTTNDGAVNFAQYDNDGPDNIPNSGDDDGFVDFVAFVHPETGGECGGNNNIWSHRFSLTGWGQACGGGIGAFTTNDASANGGNIRVDDYTIQPARSCFGGGQIEIGVFAHEFGHAFGLPDLYDTDGSSQGIGAWGLMASGSYGGDNASPDRPTHMCAWSKAYLGWITPAVHAWSDGGVAGLQILNAEENPAALKVGFAPGVSPNEYFLLEVRRKIGFDDSLIQDGLLVWHIDDAKWTPGGPNTANVQECIDGPVVGPCGANHATVALEQADGLFHLEHGVNRADAGDPFRPMAGTFFGKNTTPWTYDYNRANVNAYWLFQNLEDSQFVPSAMRFTITRPVSCGTVATDARGGLVAYALLFA
ncbi:MAG: M6 family metalloprotease domain-containing protein, partial [Myxococcales bacterium]|nr:M6 family metalloprotease domain-containing protein [Myxococcales bacterium]